MFKKTFVAAVLGLPLLASAAPNLLTNGSFESGLTGWTVAGGGTFAPVAITYGSTAPYPSSAFGLAVPADSAVNAGNTTGDPVGTQALYFVDDIAAQTVSQSFTVATAGAYATGFDWYLPANGFANPNNFAFTAKIDGVTIASFAGAVPSTWTAVTGSTALTAGSHTFTLTFTPSGVASKDLNIDRVYVTAAVPEPGTSGLMLGGLAVFGLIAARRSRV